MFADFSMIAKEQEQEAKSSIENKNKIRSMKTHQLKEYKNKVEETIKELELAIKVLEKDQQQLNAINKIINEEIGFRDYLYYLQSQ